ncbi:unnamed protein product [Cochlearia groenlandica]
MQEQREVMMSMQGHENEETINEWNFQMSYADISMERNPNICEKGDEDEKKVVNQVKCDCCGRKEECTKQYIEEVKNLYLGKWICGLCADIVIERCRKHTITNGACGTMQQALAWHKGICETFNSTTRVNPKLNFARSMLEIAKRSSQNRSPEFSLGSKIVRSVSCDPRLET